MKQELKLSEKLFCLSINPVDGGIPMGADSALKVTLAGTVLTELIYKGILKVENKRVQVVNPSFQNDEIYEFFLNPIRLKGNDRRIGRWISWYHMRSGRIRKLFIRDLVRKNVIRVEEKRFLFIPYNKLFLMDRALVENIRQEVENTLLGKTETTEESVVLALMANKTNLLKRILPDREQRKIAAKYIKTIPESSVSKAVQEAINGMHAAAVIAST